MRKKALLIFAKEPVAGQVKTRLSPFLSAETAAQLYRCMLLDTLAKAATLHDTTSFLFCHGDEHAAAFFANIAAGMVILPQFGGDLGQRMKGAFKTVFDRGYKSAAVIGTDSPDLPIAYIQEAFERLADERTGAVFGPSEDGGYYLLALNHLYEELFEGIAWSTEKVLAESMAAAGKAGIGIELLPPWYDVDSAADLLRPELLAHENGAALTGQFIRNLGLSPVT